MMTNTMPRINIDSIAFRSEYERELVGKIIATKGANKGRLRASKPGKGNAAYVWRMVAFQISPISAHHCMPVCADFDIEVPDCLTDSTDRYHFRRNLANKLSNLVDRIVNTVPATEWHGIRRWSTAFYGG